MSWARIYDLSGREQDGDNVHANHGESMTSSDVSDLTRCADRISEAVEAVFTSLTDLEDHARETWRAAAGKHRKPTSADLRSLRPAIKAQLRNPAKRFTGTGVVVAPDALGDANLHLEWWQRTAQGTLKQLVLDLDPASETFYDYREMSWFAIPRDEHRGTVIGPYVDLNGADLYIMTFTQPLTIDGDFVGIVGADVSLSGFEDLLVAALKGVEGDALLVNDEGRVLASNTPRWVPGSLSRGLQHTTNVEQSALRMPTVRWSVLRIRPGVGSGGD